jgi:hypothetical protein
MATSCGISWDSVQISTSNHRELRLTLSDGQCSGRALAGAADLCSSSRRKAQPSVHAERADWVKPHHAAQAIFGWTLTAYLAVRCLPF